MVDAVENKRAAIAQVCTCFRVEGLDVFRPAECDRHLPVEMSLTAQ